MSLTSYRAAPPRANVIRAAPRQPGSSFCFPFRKAERRRAAPPRANISGTSLCLKKQSRRSGYAGSGFENIVNGCFTPPAKPGDDLLFHCLSNSTIGAVRFHGRVRDGIGWVTDAMVTKLW